MSVTRTRQRSKHIWVKLLFAAGWGLFWLAGTAGERVPVAALLIGPGIMAAALILFGRRSFRAR